MLTDFYRARGYINFQVLSVSREFSRERDGFFLTFAVREGLAYRFAMSPLSANTKVSMSRPTAT